MSVTQSRGLEGGTGKIAAQKEKGKDFCFPKVVFSVQARTSEHILDSCY